jgi:hypothetical protein
VIDDEQIDDHEHPLGDSFDPPNADDVDRAAALLAQRFPTLNEIADWTWLPRPNTPCRDAVADYIDRAGFRLVQLHGVRPDRAGSGLWSCTCSDGYDCSRKGKHPVYEDWWRTCPGDDTTALMNWYSKFSDYNVGIETGSRTRLFVLDIDPRNGGFESFSKLEDEHGKLPRTLSVRTPTGGRHYYFFVPVGWSVPPTSIGKLGPGIDVICDGRRYVVAPPSRTPVGIYDWEISR